MAFLLRVVRVYFAGNMPKKCSLFKIVKILTITLGPIKIKINYLYNSTSYV